MAVQMSSTVRCVISTMTCLLEYWTMEGCVATSTLLSRMLTVNLLADFFCNVEESDGGMLITRYRTDERLFTWVGYRQ